MPQTALPTLLHHLRRVADPQGAAVTADTELLARFIAARDQSAFELLVWRHAHLVYNVCRRVLQREHDAEDVFQATFLMLACKAGSIHRHESLAAWLYRVAYRLALRARSNRDTRSFQERQAALACELNCSSDPSADVAQQDLCEVLDQEIYRLPAKYQAPVVLCYLEGKTNDEAAVQLRCPIGTVLTRLSRARKRLRTRLARRGIVVSVAGMAALQIIEPVPAAVIDPAIRTGTVTTIHEASATGLVSTTVATLTRGVSNAMAMTKLKIGFLVFLALSLAAAGPALFAHRLWAQDPLLVTQADRDEADLTTPDEPDQADMPPRPDEKKPAPADKHKQREKAEETVSKTFKTGSAPRLVVQLHNGGIRLEASAEREVSITVTKEARASTEEAAKAALKQIDVKMNQEGDKITLTASADEARSKDVSLGASAAIKTPAGAILELKTDNGGVTISGGTGEVRVQTSNGGVHVTDHRGAQQLKTRNGGISVSGGAGKLELETSNGPVEIQAEKALVTATTRNGAMKFEGSLAEGGKHSLHTTNGPILLTLPADARFRIDAKTSHGTIKSGFEVERTGEKSKTRLTGSVGQNPSTTLHVETTNGGVEIRPKK
jgi:RNA polymerase sigma factor (sigma-70 family)